MAGIQLLPSLVDAVQWRVLPQLQGFVSKRQQELFTNIGLKQNGPSAERALLLYARNSLGYYLKGQVEKGHKANHHFMFSLGLNMLELLVENGYVVDCYERSDFDQHIDPTPYKLIIDEGSTMGYMPKPDGQKRVFFASGLRWDTMNENMLERTRWFNEAYRMRVPPTRFQQPGFSDVGADYLMFMGREDQMENMDPQAERFKIGMPVYEEEHWTRRPGGKDFVWIGSWGALYKGLDIVTDAFAAPNMPTLHVFGFLQRERQFHDWFLQRIKPFSNIVYHGTANFQEQATQEILAGCRGHVYPSAWENGCATVAQTCHFGTIPILTATANNPADHLGIRVAGDSREELVRATREAVLSVAALSESACAERAALIEAYADQHFTRAAFVRDFVVLLRKIRASA